MNSEFCSQCGHKNYFDKKPKFCSACGAVFNQSTSTPNVSKANRSQNDSDDGEFDIDDLRNTKIAVTIESSNSGRVKMSHLLNGHGVVEDIGTRPKFNSNGKSVLKMVEEECASRRIDLDDEKD